MQCEVGAAAFAEVVLNADELQQFMREVNPMEISATKKQIVKPALSFKASEDTKKVDLVEGESS